MELNPGGAPARAMAAVSAPGAGDHRAALVDGVSRAAVSMMSSTVPASCLLAPADGSHDLAL